MKTLPETEPLDPILTNIRQFVEERLLPLEDRTRGWNWHRIEPLLQELRREVKTNGWWLPQIASEHGGMGLSLEAFGRVSEQLGRSPFGHFVCNCQAPDAGNMEILIEHGTPLQKERYLQPLLDGQIRSCFAMTEPENAGPNPTLLSTTAAREGGHYVISGGK